MNLARTQRRGGVLRERGRVRRLAVGQPPQAGVRAGERQQRIEPVLQTQERRSHAGLDERVGLPHGGAERRVPESRDVGGASGERGDERVLARRRGEELRDLPARPLRDEARRSQPASCRRGGAPACLVDPRAEFVQSGEVGVDVVRAAQRVPLRQELDEVDMDAPELVEDEAVVLVRHAREPRLERPAQRAGLQALARRQRGRIEALQLCQRCAHQRGRDGPWALRLRREAAIQRSLLGAGEVLGPGRKLGKQTDPVGGDTLRPGVEVDSLMGRCTGTGREPRRKGGTCGAGEQATTGRVPGAHRKLLARAPRATSVGRAGGRGK